MLREYDCPNHYFCLLEAPERPPSCSVLMSEYPFDATDKELQLHMRSWDEWEAAYEVPVNGYCDKHKWENDEKPKR